MAKRATIDAINFRKDVFSSHAFLCHSVEKLPVDGPETLTIS